MKLKRAFPVFASLNMSETISFYKKLGFLATYDHDPNYGIVVRDGIGLHFWKCDDRIHPENTSCYIEVEGVDALYEEMKAAGVVHPNGTLRDHPHGMREFAILDVHGNMIKFGERLSMDDGQ